jgi:hypothetical protein
MPDVSALVRQGIAAELSHCHPRKRFFCHGLGISPVPAEFNPSFNFSSDPGQRIFLKIL